MKKSELVNFVKAQKHKKLNVVSVKISEHKAILAEAEINHLGLIPLFECLKPQLDEYKKIIGYIRSENNGSTPLSESIEFGNYISLIDTLSWT